MCVVEREYFTRSNYYKFLLARCNERTRSLYFFCVQSLYIYKMVSPLRWSSYYIDLLALHVSFAISTAIIDAYNVLPVQVYTQVIY